MPNVKVDGGIHEAAAGGRLVDLLERKGITIPHVCYHPQLGPIQTRDTCLVEVDGTLVRACATSVNAGGLRAHRRSARSRALRP